VESVLVPPEHDKDYIDVSRPGDGCTEMYYVTRKSYWMQKKKFSVPCPSALFVESVPVPPKQ
jgi:hypothetical protein